MVERGLLFLPNARCVFFLLLMLLLKTGVGAVCIDVCAGPGPSIGHRCPELLPMAVGPLVQIMLRHRFLKLYTKATIYVCNVCNLNQTHFQNTANQILKF